MGDGSQADPDVVHLEDPPGSQRRACDGEPLELPPEGSNEHRRWQTLCTGCRIRVMSYDHRGEEVSGWRTAFRKLTRALTR